MWVTREIEFADGGPVLPVGCKVDVYDQSTHKSIAADDLKAVGDVVNRKRRDGSGEYVMIVHGKHLSAVPKSSLSSERPVRETAMFWRKM